ncbi:MAG TPA: PAS domain S-box protein [Candidatus Thermoplasmatota archaeon]|nr:PAS domain S-box protein [Candidatus Thermoplasmatota archaeon]
MGDTRFASHYDRVHDAENPMVELRRLTDEEVISALAEASRRRDPYLANVLATEAHNRTRRMSAVASNLGEGVLSLDRDGAILTVNAAAERLLGVDVASLVGRGGHEVVAPHDVAGHPIPEDEGPFREVLQRGVTVRLDDLSFARADGSRFDVSLTASPVIQDAEVQGLVAIFRDVTERRRAEEAIRASEALFRELLESAPDAILAVDRSGRIALANGRAEALFGYSKDEFPGVAIEHLVPERFRDTHASHRARYGRDPRLRPMGEGLDLWARRRDGTEFPVEISLSPLETPRGPLVIAVVRDVTTRRRAEEAERFLASIIRTSEEAIYAWDRDTIILSWNPGAERVYGFEASEAVGKPLAIIIPEDRVHEPAEILARIERGERIEQFETERRTKDGRLIAVSLTASPLRDATGKVVAASISARDITERKAADAALRDSRRRLAEAQALARIGSWEWNPATGAVAVSQEFARIAGLAPPEMPADFDALLLLVHPNDRLALRDLLVRSVRTSAPVDHHHRIVRPDGIVRWFHTRGEVAVDRVTGRALRLTATSQDESDRRAIEEALAESEARFRAAFDRASVGVAIATLEGRLFQTNPAFRRLLGYSAEEIARMTYADYTHPDDLDADEALARRLVAGEIDTYEIDKRYVRKDGRVVWIHLMVSLIRDAAGAPNLAAVMAQDITDRRRAEAALLASEARLASVLASVAEGIVLVDAGGQPTFTNAAAERMLGCAAPELRARGKDWLVPKEPGTDPIGAVLRERRAAAAFDAVATCPGKPSLEVAATAAPFLEGEGAVVSFHDVGPQRRLERELREVFEASSDAVLLVDENGRILLANGRAARVFGIEPARLVGSPVTTILPGLGPPDLKRREPRRPKVVDAAGLRADGTEFRVEITVSETVTERGVVRVVRVREPGP